MKFGSAYWVNFEPASPPEMGKTRPAIVVSGSIYNGRLASVVVVPLSSRAPEIWPLRLAVEVPGAKPSYAVVPGVRQISKARLHALIGQASPEVMDRVREALALYLRD